MENDVGRKTIGLTLTLVLTRQEQAPRYIFSHNMANVSASQYF